MTDTNRFQSPPNKSKRSIKAFESPLGPKSSDESPRLNFRAAERRFERPTEMINISRIKPESVFGEASTRDKLTSSSLFPPSDRDCAEPMTATFSRYSIPKQMQSKVPLVPPTLSMGSKCTSGASHKRKDSPTAAALPFAKLSLFDRVPPRMPGIESITTQDLSPMATGKSAALALTFTNTVQAVMPQLLAHREAAAVARSGSLFSGRQMDSFDGSPAVRVTERPDCSPSSANERLNKARPRLREESSCQSPSNCDQQRREEVKRESPIQFVDMERRLLNSNCRDKLFQLQMRLEEKTDSSPMNSWLGRPCGASASASMKTCQCGRRHFLPSGSKSSGLNSHQRQSEALRNLRKQIALRSLKSASSGSVYAGDQNTTPAKAHQRRAVARSLPALGSREQLAQGTVPAVGSSPRFSIAFPSGCDQQGVQLRVRNQPEVQLRVESLDSSFRSK